jgi:phosphoribosyl-ATP pyrophosphohydrolase
VSDAGVLVELWSVIVDRCRQPSVASYVSKIVHDEKGIDKVLEKVGEESTEFILAVKNGTYQRTVEEAADLQFHLMVALAAAGVSFDDVLLELQKRRR